MITFQIDGFTPCLKDVATGEIFDTEVVRIKRKTFLSKFNKKTGWYVNWSKYPERTEVYALVIKRTMDIQGVVAVQYDMDARAVYIVWGCTSPENNVWQYGKKKYDGVGGHLFAIAAELSMKKGYEGYIVAEAIDEELFQYYISEFGALSLPPLVNPYRFMLSDKMSKKLMEVYSYEWTDEEI